MRERKNLEDRGAKTNFSKEQKVDDKKGQVCENEPHFPVSVIWGGITWCEMLGSSKIANRVSLLDVYV